MVPLRRSVLRYILAVACAGVAAGFSGAVLIMILDVVEAAAWGWASGEDVLDAIAVAAPIHRVVVVALAGVLGGLVWWGLGVSRHPPVSLDRAISGEKMPLGRTFIHAVTQVVIVGCGMSIGKEVAPRELSSSAAGWIADRLRIEDEDRRILVASAAGAGLAAVYTVPLSGMAFTLELLLARRPLRAWLTAIPTSAIAVLVAHGVAGVGPYYALPPVEVDPSLLIWSIFAGPLLGFVGFGFAFAAKWVKFWHAPVWWPAAALPVVGLVVGGVAIAFPTVLGNGHSVAQLAFSSTAPTAAGVDAVFALAGLLLVVGVVKAIATVATIGAGAWGGTLTPSVAVGAALGAALGLVWSAVFPGSGVAAFAYIGAAVVLSVVQRGPITSILLVVEFTHVAGWVLVPTVIAVAGAWAVRWMLERPRRAGTVG